MGTRPREGGHPCQHSDTAQGRPEPDQILEARTASNARSGFRLPPALKFWSILFEWPKANPSIILWPYYFFSC